MMSSEFQNRTLICSVLFIDIVEYSRKSVLEQSALKERFNAVLSDALRGVAINDRIVLDTGDGAAISFIGDPEDALFVATTLRDAIARLAEGPQPHLTTRMGINLGRVRLVKDINGQPNIVGDGINVAQRVMTFAKPGQVLVSRSYYEVVSRLSEESAKLFSYEGARTDKHIREHEVYAVGALPAALRRLEIGEPAARPSGAATGGPGPGRASTSFRRSAARFFGKPPVVTALTVLTILGIALGARAWRTHEQAASEVAVRQAPAITAQEAALPPIRGLPPEPSAAVTQPIPSRPPLPHPAVEKELPTRDKPALRETTAQRAAPERADEPPRPAPAAVALAIAPWGEVHVDGRMQGVSPPLQELELAAGRHRIEIRNADSPPHVVTIDVKPGERLRIKHKFN